MGQEKDFSGSLRIEEKHEIKTQKPKMYKVILHNDDYTTMEFVVDVLIEVFDKTRQEATIIMLDVHKKGKGICGIYTYDIAVTKAEKVRELARQRDFPLLATVEEA